jgi:hypothetical protein
VYEVEPCYLITKEEFEKYENLRQSGVINMFDVKTIMFITGLEIEQVLYIMDNYSSLMKEYKENVENGK